MRSFKNKKGEKVEIPKEYLDISVKLKKELQMQSPSHRCDWKKLCKMLKKEGFPYAEPTESFRCLVKDYQESIGELPTKEKYADIVSTSKLNSIKEAVGELYYAKREVQLDNLKLGRIKRELTLYGVVSEEIINMLKSVDFNNFNDIKKVEVKGESKALVLFNDWHIGLRTPNYNYDIAKDRVSQYVESILKHCRRFSIDEIFLAGNGDLVENVYMRTTQAYDVEFNFSEQIAKASELVIYMLNSLQKHVHVNYLGINNGNHDRLFIKDKTLENDSAMKIIDFIVTSYIETSKLKNVTIKKDNFDGTYIITNINGFNIKIAHGDKESKSDLNKIKKHMSLDNTFYDMMVFGHFHYFGVTEENDGRLCVNIGCLQGSTDYSKSLGFNTDASQGIIIVTEDDLIPIRIGFNR